MVDELWTLRWCHMKCLFAVHRPSQFGKLGNSTFDLTILIVISSGQTKPGLHVDSCTFTRASSSCIHSASQISAGLLTSKRGGREESRKISSLSTCHGTNWLSAGSFHSTSVCDVHSKKVIIMAFACTNAGLRDKGLRMKSMNNESTSKTTLNNWVAPNVSCRMRYQIIIIYPGLHAWHYGEPR